MFKSGKDALPVFKCQGAIRLSYCFATGLLKPGPRNIEQLPLHIYRSNCRAIECLNRGSE